jgi:hypothetical protein
VKELSAVSLDGFEPSWGDCEVHWGPAVDYNGAHWKDYQYHAEVLARFDHDYLGTHLFVQVWDYAQQDDPDQRWQYMLLLHRPERIVEDGAIVHTDWAWCIRVEYEEPWTEGGPSYAKVGEDVDIWLRAPEYLRFIIE